MASTTPTRHPSVAALLKAHPGQGDAKTIIQRLARAKVAYAKKRQWQGPPFCPKQLASIFGIRCKEVEHDIGGEGRILRQPSGQPLIEYRHGLMAARQRFTLFHEFAHTLFPDYCDYVRHHSVESALTQQEKEFENLCDIAAAEMLFPEAEFSRDLMQQAAADLTGAHQLAERYEASLDATVHRLVVYEDRAICAAVFLTDQKASFSGDGPLWVKYSVLHKKFSPFIWPGTVPPAESVAVQCFQKGGKTTRHASETWAVKSTRVSWRVQAAKLPTIVDSPSYAKVVALLVTENGI